MLARSHCFLSEACIRMRRSSRGREKVCNFNGTAETTLKYWTSPGAQIIASTWRHSRSLFLKIQACRRVFLSRTWLDPSGHWRMSLAGRGRLPGLGLFPGPGLPLVLLLQSHGHGTPAVMQQMAAYDKALLIGNKNPRSFTAPCPNTWSHCRALGSPRVRLESGLVFSTRSPPQTSQLARWVLEALLRFVKRKSFFFNQPSKPYPYPRGFLTHCPWFGVGGEKNFDLLQNHFQMGRLTQKILPLSSRKRCCSWTKLWENAELGMGAQVGAASKRPGSHSWGNKSRRSWELILNLFCLIYWTNSQTFHHQITWGAFMKLQSPSTPLPPP